MSKRPYYLAGGAALLVVLIVLQLPERTAGQFKLMLGGVFLPLFGLAGSGEGLGQEAKQALTTHGTLLRQVAELRQENQRLQLQIMQWQEAWRENTRLKLALGWQQSARWKLKPARVLGQDPANWWRTLHISLGARDGVYTSAPVLTADGLVGRVTEVGFTRSRVVMVGDPACRFSALVQETRDKGIITPEAFSLDHLLVGFTFVPVGVGLRPGQWVLTSGDGGVFPKGIPVGQVVDIQTNEFGLYLEARVRLSVNLNRLEEVWVLFP
jgi:rod shape-determining protein MreC